MSQYTDGMSPRQRAAFEQAQIEIRIDVDGGTLPMVGSFSELHDYVDANAYADCFTLNTPEAYPAERDYGYEAIDAVQDTLDRWIKAGGLYPAPALGEPGHQYGLAL